MGELRCHIQSPAFWEADQRISGSDCQAKEQSRLIAMVGFAKGVKLSIEWAPWSWRIIAFEWGTREFPFRVKPTQVSLSWSCSFIRFLYIIHTHSHPILTYPYPKKFGDCPVEEANKHLLPLSYEDHIPFHSSACTILKLKKFLTLIPL